MAVCVNRGVLITRALLSRVYIIGTRTGMRSQGRSFGLTWPRLSDSLGWTPTELKGFQTAALAEHMGPHKFPYDFKAYFRSRMR